MLFTPRNDQSRRLADGPPGQNPAARIMPVAPFWPHGLPEGRTGRQGYPGLRHARSEPPPVGWINHRSTEPDRSRKNRVAQTDRQPDGATKPRPPAVQKASTCDSPDFAKGQTGQPCRTGQDNHGPKLPANLPARRALALSSLAPNDSVQPPARKEPER